jgi:hypothetical protein
MRSDGVFFYLYGRWGLLVMIGLVHDKWRSVLALVSFATWITVLTAITYGDFQVERKHFELLPTYCWVVSGVVLGLVAVWSCWGVPVLRVVVVLFLLLSLLVAHWLSSLSIRTGWRCLAFYRLRLVVPSMRVMPYQCFEYRVLLYSQFVVNLDALVCHFVNVEPFKGVQHPPLLCELDYIHYVFYGAKFMSVIQEVLGKFSFFCTYV